MSRRRSTHCRRGHEFAPGNVYVPPGRPAERVCRQCRALREQRPAYQAKSREAGRRRTSRLKNDPEARERRRLGAVRYRERHREEIRLRRQERGVRAKKAEEDRCRRQRIKADPELRRKRALQGKRYRETHRELIQSRRALAYSQRKQIVQSKDPADE